LVAIVEKPIYTDAIVKSYNHHVHVTGLDEPSTVDNGVRVGVEATALDEEEDRELVFARGIRRGKDIDEETVLRVCLANIACLGLCSDAF
jgi:hypothetical protein